MLRVHVVDNRSIPTGPIGVAGSETLDLTNTKAIRATYIIPEPGPWGKGF